MQVAVRRRKPAELLADPDFVYVGRRHPAGWTASKWANPFKSGMTHEEAVTLFRRLAHNEPVPWPFGDIKARSPVEWFDLYLKCKDSLIESLPTLVGKRLGCWCGEWSEGHPDIGCHAVAIAKIVNKIAKGEPL